MTDLQERYGQTRRSRKALVAVLVLVIGLGLSWLAWVILALGRPAVESNLVTYEVTGPHAAEASFVVVRRDAEVEASCLLRAVAADHAIVGELHVLVGPGGATTRTLQRTVRTEREATSVQMVGCVSGDQPRRR